MDDAPLEPEPAWVALVRVTTGPVWGGEPLAVLPECDGLGRVVTAAPEGAGAPALVPDDECEPLA